MDLVVTSAKAASLQLELGNESTTADINVKPAGPDWASYPLYHAIKLMSPVWLAIVFFLGTFGNLMTIILTRRMASDKSTVNLYFTAIAISDSIFLPVITLPWWFRQVVSYDVRVAHTVICKLHTFLYAGTATVSCWCVVCMTVHRAMSVVWPHRVSVFCTRRTVLLVITGITVFFALLYSHYIIGSGIVPRKNKSGYCTQTEDFQYFVNNIFVFIDLTVYSVLPFVILVAANGVLMWKLRASVKAADKHLAHGDSEQVQARERAANSVTLTVMVVSLVFLVLTLPAAIFAILSHSAMVTVVLDLSLIHKSLRLIVVNDVCVLLGISNGAVNFYLYCLTGRRFREEFIKIMCLWRRG
ncbi:hypothetical protein ACOMHN_043010 [Nucella lapillus]